MLNERGIKRDPMDVYTVYNIVKAYNEYEFIVYYIDEHSQSVQRISLHPA